MAQYKKALQRYIVTDLIFAIVYLALFILEHWYLFGVLMGMYILDAILAYLAAVANDFTNTPTWLWQAVSVHLLDECDRRFDLDLPVATANRMSSAMLSHLL